MGSGAPASNSLRLLLDLQQVSQIAQAFSGCLEPTAIAKQVTDQLVMMFDCAFARIWLVEPDQTTLRLVASSGLYTHTDGSFARVPMGAFKVGKIAQNRIPFLSNHLAEEPWVKDRSWAITHKITGFAGYPLAVGNRVVGVLAVFSHQPLSPEFLEVLQWLCTIVTVALDSALAHQQAQQIATLTATLSHSLPLSEQMAALLPQTRLALVGTERTLSVSLHYLLLQVGEILSQFTCPHARLMYEASQITLDAMVTPELLPRQTLAEWIALTFEPLRLALTGSGGEMQTVIGATPKTIQVILQLPYHHRRSGNSSLSEREREMLLLLTQGLRDREIAHQLHISERTVKFHINNAIVKLKAQTRYQALYQAIVQGCLD